MNMNRIINMIIKQVIRLGISGVMKSGMSMFTKSRGKTVHKNSQDAAQINVSKEDNEKMRAVRRNRF